MVQITGRYKYEGCCENFIRFFNVFGRDGNEIKAIIDSKPILEVACNGDEWSISVEDNGKIGKSVFKLGQLYDEILPFCKEILKSVTTRDGDKLVTINELPGDIKITRVYEFTDEGLQVHMDESGTGVKTTRRYKRL